MKNKAMAYKPKDYIRKLKEKPIEKPADIGTKPVPSWIKKEILENK